MDDYGYPVMTPDRFRDLEQEVRNHSLELSRIAMVLESLGANQAKMLEMFEEHIRVSERQHAMAARQDALERAVNERFNKMNSRIADVAKEGRIDWVRWVPAVITVLAFLGIGVKLTVGQ